MDVGKEDWADAILKVKEVMRLSLARRGPPLVVALDGGSGAGKSTLAHSVRETFGGVIVPLDDFFSAQIPDHQWDAFTVEERSNNVFDWRRLREEALVPLRAGRPARWHAFDFTSGLQPDGTYRMQPDPVERQPAEVILLEGAYSSHPTIADLVDLAILVDVPMDIRHRRLVSREGKDFLQQWHHRWDPVEIYYFTHVRPRSSFDLVVVADGPTLGG